MGGVTCIAPPKCQVLGQGHRQLCAHKVNPQGGL